MATTKKGNARARAVDLTAQRMARPIIWNSVYRFIFQVLTCNGKNERKKKTSKGSCFHTTRTSRTHPSNIRHLRMVFHGHEEQRDAIEELDSVDGADAHVEEDSEQDCEGHQLEDGGQPHGKSHQDGHDQVG